MPKLRSPTAKRIKLRAIHPSAGVRVWYERELDGLLQGAHVALTAELSAMWPITVPVGLAVDGAICYPAPRGGDVAICHPAQHFYTADEDGHVIEASRGFHPPYWTLAYDAPSPAVTIQKILKKWGDKWSAKFDKMSADLARAFAARNFHATEQAMRAAFKDAGFTVKFKPTKKSIEAYRAVVAENINLIKSIPQKYLTDVQTSVWQSVNRGADLSTLSKRLQQNYGVSIRRAALIARDQNAKAKAVIENTRRQELGIKQAIWQHSAGGKEPRPTHVAANGETFDLATGMWDSDENEYVLPGQLINCRCTSRGIIPGLEDEE